jgi:hypothetical protein
MKEKDKEFEAQLKAALRREPAPADFAAKVLANAGRKNKVVVMLRRPATWTLAAALAVAAIVPPAVMEYRRRQEARALEARRELILALNITRAKLQQTKERIQRNARRPL